MMRFLLTILALIAGVSAGADPVDDAHTLYLLGEYEAALVVLIPAAEAGNSTAQNLLGTAYDRGTGVIQDSGKALEWWEKSAKQGHGAARFNLGQFHQHGRDGHPADIETAITWYVRAGASKQPEAFTNLGQIFERGARGEPDFDLAQQYYRGGVALGSAQSMANLGTLYATGRGVTRDYSDALALFQEGASLGNAAALTGLATLYENGQGVVRDAAAAHALYQSALAAGSADAALRLAFLARDTRGYWSDDPVRALGYCLKALDLAEDHANEITPDCNVFSKDLKAEDEAGARDFADSLNVLGRAPRD